MSNKVTIYSKAGCGECVFTKKYLEQNGVDYQEFNLTQEPQYLQTVTDLGFSSLPVVVIEGQEAFSGFQPQRLETLVG